MKTSQKILAGIALLLSYNTYAVDYSELAAYEIEVIIFKFTDSRSAGSEIWPDLVKTESVKDSIELHNNSSTTRVPGPDEKAYYYSKIPAEKFRLANEAERLEKSDEYEILYHAGWIQPGLDKENAEYIHIKTIDSNNNQLSLLNALPDATNKQQISFSNSQSASQQAVDTFDENTILEGLIKVELARYLHIHFDLKYQRDLAPTQGVMETTVSESHKEIKYYPIQTHRRMRSKELHYIDHPLIGILVLATPFEIEGSEGTEEAGPLMKLGNVPVKN